jgi:uncharacterized protein (TIGR02757 family)
MRENFAEIKELLELKHDLYNRVEFIPEDPISVPHLFNKKEDIEIAGFFAAILSWGKRKTIIANATRLMQLMDYSPYDFIMQASNKELEIFNDFRHRTFNGTDCNFFIRSLRNIYREHGGIEIALAGRHGVKPAIIHFRNLFFSIPHPDRTIKHIADPQAGATAKRMNMFLRWMVRKDARGVDFGIWESLRPSQLYCPLDVHTGNTARKLGLITRKQNDWNALEELMGWLRSFDPDDPVRFDFSLFGLGIYEEF